MTEPLYNSQILRLAASVPFAERLHQPQATVTKVSPICGSRVTVDLDLDSAGRIGRFGQEVRACALGQAAASLLGNSVIGRNAAELATARDGLAAFLRGTAETPGDWPGLDIFAPARPHKARHASILLAFDAATEAAAQARHGHGALAGR